MLPPRTLRMVLQKQYIACNICPGKLHTLIHGSERVFPSKTQPKGRETVQILLVHAPKLMLKPVLLVIAPTVVRNANETIITLGVLDPASEVTLIKSSLAQRLCLKEINKKVQFGSFHTVILLNSSILNITIESVDGARVFQVSDAFTVPGINQSPRNINS